MTAAEIMNLMAGFRASCQPRFDLSDDLVDGINLGRFPDNNELKVRQQFLNDSPECKEFLFSVLRQMYIRIA